MAENGEATVAENTTGNSTRAESTGSADASGGTGPSKIAVTAAALAAAGGASALMARRSRSTGGVSGGGDKKSTSQSEGGGAKKDGMMSVVVAASRDAVIETLIPAAEDAATAAGRYVAHNGPELLRERLVPKFVAAYVEARGGDASTSG